MTFSIQFFIGMIKESSMRKNKDKEWLSGPGLVVLVIMSPIVVILAVQALTAVYTVLH
ncbi:hypothetical protein ACI1TU_00290 [Lactococcus garvieae]